MGNLSGGESLRPDARDDAPVSTAPGSPGQRRQGVWSPAIECRRVNGELLVTAELPGVKKEDIKVQVLDESLIVEGERKLEAKEEKEGYFRSERSYGKFWRQIPLPKEPKPTTSRLR
jgi:HSP20 family protein